MIGIGGDSGGGSGSGSSSGSGGGGGGGNGGGGGGSGRGLGYLAGRLDWHLRSWIGKGCRFIRFRGCEIIHSG